MAFYNDAPGRKPQKKNHSAGSWADEGSNYTGARRFGPKRDDDRPSYGKREDRPYGERKSFGRDDRRPLRNDNRDRDNNRFEKREFRKGDRKDFRRDDRRDFKPAEPKAAPSYRDAEYRAATPAAPTALEVMETMQQENLLAGRNPIREALKAGRDIEKLLVLKGELSGSAREIVQMAREAHIVVQEVEKIRLDELAHNHQGLVAFASA